MRSVVLAVGCVLAVWACSSEESGGGSGGSAGSGGDSTGGTAGSGGSAGDGATGGSAGSSGASGSAGTGGAEDAGMDVMMLDVYVYQPCDEGCNKTIPLCNGTQAEIEECISTCTSATLGPCGDEMKALVACFLTSDIQCDGTQPVPTDCGTEAQAFSTCDDNN